MLARREAIGPVTLLDHTKLDSTARYLGVGLEDALTMSEAIDR